MKAHLMFVCRALVLALAVPMALTGCQEDLELTERSFACSSDSDCLLGLTCGAEGRCVSPDEVTSPADVPDATDAPETTEDITGPPDTTADAGDLCSDTCPELGLVKLGFVASHPFSLTIFRRVP